LIWPHNAALATLQVEYTVALEGLPPEYDTVRAAARRSLLAEYKAALTALRAKYGRFVAICAAEGVDLDDPDSDRDFEEHLAERVLVEFDSQQEG